MKSTPSHYYLNFPSIWDKKSWKTIALVKVETLGPFVNTLTADDKYSRRNVQNFQQQLPMALSQKQHIFPAIFTSFPKSTSKFKKFFFKKDESPSLSISQIIDSERGGYLNI